MQERLQKILAQRNVASRRAVEQLILAGRVQVNGQVAKLGDKADADDDEILLDGQPLPPVAGLRYVLLYKPAGYITSVKDERGRRTVLDLLQEAAASKPEERLYPVGRLDYATSGVLLLTNDGELTQALLHPKGEITKVYQCAVRGKVTLDKLRRLEQGIELEDGWTAPAKARRVNDAVVELAIHEGRNRQVRRMMAAVGLDVVWLKRISFAGLTLHGLQPGQWRELTASELDNLLQLKAHIHNKKMEARKNDRN